MLASDTTLGPVVDIASALVGSPIDVLQQVGGGRNSRVFHVRSAGREFALKQYPPREDDPRDRLATEVGALRLMERYHVDVVPRVLGVDASRGFALLSWVDGAQVDQIGDSDIDAAVTFLSAIHDLRGTPWALQQPLAAEACLCGGEIVSQIKGRLQRLRELPELDPDLIDFIDNSFASAFAGTAAKSQRELSAAGLDFALELPQKGRSLVPSDFGFHNSLRRGDGSLAFLDFEYFGWDDPVKLTADIMLHPGRELTPSLRRRFRGAAVSLYGEDKNFQQRLTAFLPLFGLRWVLILLNEFIPERWRRRVLAGATESWSEAKARQLKFVRSFLASLSQRVEE